MSKKPTLCAVEWCCALPVRGETVCAVHRIAKTIHPEPLADGEAYAFIAVESSYAAPTETTRDECDECGGNLRAAYLPVYVPLGDPLRYAIEGVA